MSCGVRPGKRLTSSSLVTSRPPGAVVIEETPTTARAIVDGLQKAGVTPDKLAGGHGAVGDYADLVKYVE